MTQRGLRILGRLTVGLVLMSALSCDVRHPQGSGETVHEYGSGLVISKIPDGYEFTVGYGNTVGSSLVFTNENGAEFSVARFVSTPPLSIQGHRVQRGDRVFAVDQSEDGTRVVEDVGNGVRIEVASRSLSAEVLLEIAEATRYDPTRDPEAWGR
jgi:hypothetical protein